MVVLVGASTSTQAIMAKVDADINYLLFYVVLPVFGLLLVLRFMFGLSLEKLEPLVIGRILTWISRRYLKKEKLLLFEHLGDLKENSRHAFSVLEVGVGGGENFQFYPKGTILSCVEPNHNFDDAWMKKLKKYKHIQLGESFNSYAEDMNEVKSNTYDVVVCTLIMCTVKDPPAALKEIHRVLKPGGTFFFMEHVAGRKGTPIRVVQDIMMSFTPYSRLTKGCNLNRETWTSLDESRFKSIQYRHYSIDSWILFFLRPFLYGTAVK